jgi:dipeptidyl aminopeptidase/acylaminoacyl peptidase
MQRTRLGATREFTLRGWGGLAAHGYVVVCVNYHRSAGFGHAWLESITGNYGAKKFADTEAATDFMLRKGYIDAKRQVASGGSYGGYMVAYMNGHTDRCRAYVCRGISPSRSRCDIVPGAMITSTGPSPLTW